MTVPGSNLMMKMFEVLVTPLVLTTGMIFVAADKGAPPEEIIGNLPSNRISWADTWNHFQVLSPCCLKICFLKFDEFGQYHLPVNPSITCLFIETEDAYC